MKQPNEATLKRVRAMTFAKVYPMYVAKAERKGRAREEVDQVIRWLTGYTPARLASQIKKQASFEEFFTAAPKMNPDRALITGTVCGVRVEEVKDPIMREVRYLDKLVDELAKGWSMEKVLRQADAGGMKSFATIDEYIRGVPKVLQPRLLEMRDLVRRAAPKGKEVIRYGMPTIQINGKNLIHYAAMKGHLGFYPAPSGVTAFETEITKLGLGFSKGCVRIPYDKPLPAALVKCIITFRLKEETAR
jgi:uncharacterized protein YdhG (YjbR/CyaY superfamily)